MTKQTLYANTRPSSTWIRAEDGQLCSLDIRTFDVSANTCIRRTAAVATWDEKMLPALMSKELVDRLAVETETIVEEIESRKDTLFAKLS